MRRDIWALTAAMVTMGVGTLIYQGVDYDRTHPAPQVVQAQAQDLAAAPALRVPVASPWAPGTAVTITTTRPVPGETIQVGQCTVAYSFTAGEQAYAVTASHCGSPGDYVWATEDGATADFSEPVGSFVYSDLYDLETNSLDVGLIEISDTRRVMLAPDPGAPTVVASDITDLPETICKYGTTTGETCGQPLTSSGVEILADNHGLELRALASTAAICARAGDSGGPVYADLDGQRVIIGLVSGTRDAAAEHQCDAPAGPDMAMSYTAMPGILEVIDREVPAAEYHTP